MRDLFVEERAEIVQVVFLHDDDDLLDARLQRLFDDQQDSRLGDAVPVDDREQLLLGGFAGGEQARAKARRRDDRLAHPGARAQRQLTGRVTPDRAR